MSNYGQQSSAQVSVQSQNTNAPPDSSALHGILRRIAEVRSNLHDIHGIADRACGSYGIGDAQTAPKGVPNGMLAEIEEALDFLMGLSAAAAVRLSHIA